MQCDAKWLCGPSLKNRFHLRKTLFRERSAMHDRDTLSMIMPEIASARRVVPSRAT